MGPIGVQEMLAIFVLALLLFGPKKLPELGRMLGKALTEFRRAKNELKSTFESHLSELEREVQADNYSTPSTTDSSAHYPYPYDEYGHQQSDYDSSPPSYAADESSQTPTPEPYVRRIANAQEGQDHPDAPSTNDSLVPGTVPRSGGFRPSASVSLATDEKESA